VAWFIKNINDLPGMSGSAKAFNPINLLKFTNRIEHVFKPNSHKGSLSNISQHYDLNNDFFKLFLDPSMTYSSALFSDKNQPLEEAQENKYDSLCQLMKINEKDHVLEIGCGWGGFAVFAAKKYGCKITGITISKEQYEFAKKRIKKVGLENQIEILMKDYRDLEGKFDKVVSIEMIEAVGHRYFKSYFGKINQVLSEKGVLGLQAIIIPDKRYNEYRKSVDWIQKHIFPGGLLPSIGKINETINQTGNLNLFSLKDMGLSYAQTLNYWFVNFQNNLEGVRQLGFDESFIRKWQFYLCSCEAAFAERNINVVQMVYARPNNPSF
jgi:cyclopropane-fatty-acyl-phospholipid synthase